MKRILVIQLCRLGDLLQTTPMLRGLRRMHPGAHVTLMALDGFSRTPVPARLFDTLAVFPFDSVAAEMHARDSWPQAVRTMRSFVQSLGEEPFDLVLNVTGNEVANLLSAIIPSREVRGGLVASDRTRVVRHPWMTYFWSSLLAREAGAVNLVDLFSRVAEVPVDDEGLEMDVPASAHEAAAKWLADRGHHRGPFVALQLGASEDRKRWQPEQFAAMANRLPARLGPVIFVGSAAEGHLAARAIARLDRPYFDATGATSLTELAALLSRASLLVTNDTGTMHVATAMGTRILDLSTGPVFVHETGPYAVGSIAVEPSSGCFPCAAGAVCRHLTCRDDFTPDEIAAVAVFALEGGAMPRPARARVLRAARSASGRMEFRSIWDPAATSASDMRHALARMWESSLGFVQPIERAAGADMVPDDVDPALLDALNGLESRAREASALARRLSRSPAQVLGELAATLEARLERELTAAVVAPVLAPLVAYLRTALDSLTDRSVVALADAYHREWAATAARARSLQEELSRGSAAAARMPMAERARR
jgi:ADP-heptose:LPS heptosyltransferase